MTTLAKALLAFQADAPPVHLDATNPHFRNKYASLGGVVAAIRPALNRCGLVYSQLPTNVAGSPALRTILMHADSGECLEDTMPLILPKNDPQGQGSALTYARRYALLSILGLVGDDDDDANAATTAAAAPDAQQFHAPEPVRDADPHGLRSSRADAPQDGGDPASVVCHFGKNAGTTLGALTQKQRMFYAETWAPDTSKYPLKPEDRRLRMAARILCGISAVEDSGVFAQGGQPLVDDDIPFMWNDGYGRELGVWHDPWRRG